MFARQKTGLRPWKSKALLPMWLPFMPLVLINPQIRPFGPGVTGPEGCPEFSGNLRGHHPSGIGRGPGDERQGEKIEFKAGGLLSRAIQHEVDHLNGILFIDRMSSLEKSELKPELDSLQTATKEELKKKK